MYFCVHISITVIENFTEIILIVFTDARAWALHWSEPQDTNYYEKKRSGGRLTGAGGPG